MSIRVLIVVVRSILICGAIALGTSACAPTAAVDASAPDPGPGANNAPVISGTPDTTVRAGATYSFRPTASDADGDTLIFQVVNAPAWSTFDTTNGQLSGTPAESDVGSYDNIQITATDGKAQAVLPAFAVQVTPGTTPPPPPANSPPTISGVPAPSVVAGNAYLFRPTAADVDGDLLTFVITNKPSWASFSAGSGQLSGTPQAANVGNYGNIMISVSDGHSTVALPAFSIQVQAKANTAPTIGGTPPTTVTVGSAYAFQPTASDADSDPLTFSISNKPSWASFSTSNGRLSGTPTAAGTFANVGISVTDGKSTTSLAPFTITVNAATTGSASVSWVPPTTNSDGSPLTNLAGFRVYYGTSTGALSLANELSNPAATTYTVNNLASGTWYFSVRSYTTSGLESTDSTIGSKTIP